MGTQEMTCLHLLDSVSHRHLGLVILALLGLTALLGVVLVLLCRRLQPGKLTFGRGKFRWSQLLTKAQAATLRPPSGKEWLRQGKGLWV